MNMNKYRQIVYVLCAVLLGVGLSCWYTRKLPADNPADNEARTPSSASKTPGVRQDVEPAQGFASMGIIQRNAILTDLGMQKLSTIMQAWWKAGLVEKDLMKQGAIASIMALAIREHKADGKELIEIEQFIMNSDNPSSDKAQLLSVLGDAETRESIQLLLDLVPRLGDRPQKQVALTSISQLGARGGSREELSPLLERAWVESADRDIYLPVAMAMAQVGAASGIDLLVAAVSATKSENADRQKAASSALAEVTIRNPNAVSSLSSALNSQPPESGISKLAGNALARMVDPAGTQAVVDWLKMADDGAAPRAHEYVVRIRHPTQLKVWESVAGSDVGFRSAKVQEAIQSGLAEYKQGRDR